jgi:hypothetical protein
MFQIFERYLVKYVRIILLIKIDILILICELFSRADPLLYGRCVQSELGALTMRP